VGIAFWSDTSAQAKEWDACRLDDEVLPGLCRLEHDGRENPIDVQKGKGSEAPKTEPQGRMPAEGTLYCLITQAAQWTRWQELVKKLDPPIGSELKPYRIYHPNAAHRGIENIFITRVGGPMPSSLGGLEVPIFWTEFFQKPKPAKVTKKPAQQLTAFENEWRETEETKWNAEDDYLTRQQELDQQLQDGDIGIVEYDAAQTEAEDDYLDKLDAADADQAALEESGWEENPDGQYFDQLTDSDEL